MVDVEIQASAK